MGKVCRDVAKVFNKWESCNDRQVFEPKAHSRVPLAHYRFEGVNKLNK